MRRARTRIMCKNMMCARKIHHVRVHKISCARAQNFTCACTTHVKGRVRTPSARVQIQQN